MSFELLYVIYALLLSGGLALLLVLRGGKLARAAGRHRGEIIALSAITIFFLALNYDLLLGTGTTPRHDNIRYAFPFFHFTINGLIQTGDFPAWLPYIGGGQTTFLYLNNVFLLHIPRLLIYVLFPVLPEGMDLMRLYWWDLLLSIIIFSAGSWLFFRLLTRSAPAALFGYAVCLFSGITAGTLHQEQVLVSSFYIPWILAFGLLFARGGSRLWGIAAALLAGLSLLNHYPHLVAYFWAALIFSLAVFHYRAVAGLIKTRRKTLLAMAALVLAFASVDLLMFGTYSDLVTSPYRQGATGGVAFSYEQLTGGGFLRANSAALHSLLHYVAPETFYSLNSSRIEEGVTLGVYWIDNRVLYLGLFTLFFALYELLTMRKRPSRAFALSAFFMLILSMGGYSFGYFLLYRFLPLAGMQRIPSHLLNYLNFLLLTLAVMGLEAAIARGRRKEEAEEA